MEVVAVTGEEIRISWSKSILVRCATDGPEASTPAVLSFVREWRTLRSKDKNLLNWRITLRIKRNFNDLIV